MTLTKRLAVRRIHAAVITLALALPALVHADDRAPGAGSVSVRVEGESKAAAGMLERLRTRGARRGITVTEAREGYQLRVLVLARGPQWHQVFGVSASGAVAVLDGSGELLFMHLRQKETTAGLAMDAMADEILERLPALLRGEMMLAQ